MRPFTLALLACSIISFASPSHAQKKKTATKPAVAKTKKTPAKPKSAAKPPAPKGPIVLGTTQLPGDFGKLGQTYTIGKYQPINFTLKSAEYSIEPFVTGTNINVPKADQKMLILRYLVHNPNPSELAYNWSGIRFTAVDAKDVNNSFITSVNREGTTEPLNLRLKPAQKVDVVAAIPVPAEGVIPKLIVEREQGAPVIRYDLRGKVKALPEPFADSADSSGATARKEVPVKAGVFVPMGTFDMKLDEVGSTTETLIDKAAPSGSRFVTAVFTIKNRSSNPARYAWSTFMATLRDADGEKVPYNQVLLKASRNERAQGSLAPGEEARIRFAIPLLQSIAPKSLNITGSSVIGHSSARTFSFDLSGSGG